MRFYNRMIKTLGKPKTKEELDEHYKGMDLEKGDFTAMLIAAIITFLPVAIIAMVVIYGLIWLLAVL